MQFLYEAVDSAGQKTMGRIEASSQEEAAQRLLQSGYRAEALALVGGASQSLSPMVSNAPANVVPAVNPVTPVRAASGSRTGGGRGFGWERGEDSEAVGDDTRGTVCSCGATVWAGERFGIGGSEPA